MNVIEELYYGNIRPIEGTYLMNPQRQELSEEAEKIKAKLLSTFNSEQRELFNSFWDRHMKIICKDEERQFTYAFRLGMQLTVDGLSENVRNDIQETEDVE